MKRLVLLLAVWSVAGLAEVLPHPGIGDPHIQTVDYDPNQVVRLQVAPGYALTIEFSPDERIENVAVGASGAWQITPNRRADHLFVKPASDGAPETNMTVLTDARRYVFTLAAGDGGNTPYVLRFVYPGLTTAPEIAVETARTPYRLSGARALRPLAMSDDGRSTSIRWAPDATLPAVYAIDGKGHETIVNGAMRGGVFIVDAVAPKFVFRSGTEKAMATRIRPRRK